MTVLSTIGIPALVAIAVLLMALLGPRAVRAAAPALMRAPRLAVALLGTSLVLWLTTAVSVVLILTWTLSGPQLLPGVYGDVCRRCLDAVRPFETIGTVQTPVPVAVLIAVSAAIMVALPALGAVRLLPRRAATRRIAAQIAPRAERRRTAGVEVSMIADPRPIAFTLPARHGGIVISDGLLDALSGPELTAVLEHEQAHQRQHHHLVMTALTAVAQPLRWVPLIRAVHDAVPHYLEIAADDAARDRCGTRALASALLVLGAPQDAPSAGISARTAGMVLHAAGPDRIGHLVAPARIRSAVLPLTMLAVQIAGFAAIVLTVHGSYVRTALTACGLTG